VPLRTALPLILVGCLALAAPPLVRNASATAAAVTPSPGKFLGTTSRAQETVHLTVSRRHDITEMSFLLFYRCPDGYRNFQAVIVPITSGNLLAVIRGTFNRSWHGTYYQGATSGSYSDKVAGSFPSAKRATGTIALTLDRAGHGQCTSGTVSWTARRVP